MTHEREASDRQLPDGSTASSEECVKFFVTTLANLNKIYEEQLEGLVKIVITIAEKYDSLASAKPDQQMKSRARTTGDELAALVEQWRSATEASRQSHIGQPGKMNADGQSAAEDSDTFCDKVEAALILAMLNSVQQQQQMYVTGIAILTMGTAQLFSISAPTNSKAQGTQEASK